MAKKIGISIKAVITSIIASLAGVFASAPAHAIAPVIATYPIIESTTLGTQCVANVDSETGLPVGYDPADTKLAIDDANALIAAGIIKDAKFVGIRPEGQLLDKEGLTADDCFTVKDLPPAPEPN